VWVLPEFWGRVGVGLCRVRYGTVRYGVVWCVPEPLQLWVCVCEVGYRKRELVSCEVVLVEGWGSGWGRLAVMGVGCVNYPIEGWECGNLVKI
jgi:hypothetical protein